MPIERIRSERDARKAAAYSDEELAAASGPVDEETLKRRQDFNKAELLWALSRAKDEKTRGILSDEYNKQFGELNPDEIPSGLTPVTLPRAAAGATSAPGVSEPPSGMTPTYAAPPVFTGALPQPDLTKQANESPGAPTFVGTPEGAVTGIERPRVAGPEQAEPIMGPAEKRLLIETGATAAGGLAGSLLGPVGERLGETVGSVFGSIGSEFVDPTKEPIKEALKTGGMILGTGLIASGITGGLRAALGKPSEAGQHLLGILEAEGRVPTAGAVLEGSLARNMQAIGSSDAFFGQRVKDAVAADGNVVTNRVRNYVSGYQRYYDSAKQGFSMFDNSLKTLLPPGENQIVAIDRGVLDKLGAAQRTWESVGAGIDFPLREMFDRLAAAEAQSGKLNAFRVSVPEAEAIRQLLHEQANALSGGARAANSAVVGKDVVQAIRRAANGVGDDINAAIDLAIKDNRIPADMKAILVGSRDLWQQWKQGEVIQDAIGAALKESERTGAAITSNDIFKALASIDKDSKDLKRALITPDQEAHLMGMAKALQANEKAGHNATFNMAVRSGQLFTLSTAAFGAAAHPLTAGIAAGIALVPGALGWIVRNPRASALLIRGLRTDPGTAAAARTARELTTLLAEHGFLAPTERPDENAD